jgi:hypothetical protein
MGIVTRRTRTLAFWSEKAGGSPKSLSSFCVKPHQPLHTSAYIPYDSPYLKHEPNIPKLQNRIPTQGKVEVLQVECLFVEEIQPREGKAE